MKIVTIWNNQTSKKGLILQLPSRTKIKKLFPSFDFHFEGLK